MKGSKLTFEDLYVKFVCLENKVKLLEQKIKLLTMEKITKKIELKKVELIGYGYETQNLKLFIKGDERILKKVEGLIELHKKTWLGLVHSKQNKLFGDLKYRIKNIYFVENNLLCVSIQINSFSKFEIETAKIKEDGTGVEIKVKNVVMKNENQMTSKDFLKDYKKKLDQISEVIDGGGNVTKISKITKN